MINFIKKTWYLYQANRLLGEMEACIEYLSAVDYDEDAEAELQFMLVQYEGYVDALRALGVEI